MDNPGQAAARRLETEMRAWKSIELSVDETHTDHAGVTNGGTASTVEMQERYIETALGQRFAELLSRSARGDARLYQFYKDGNRFADVNHQGGYGSAQKSVVLKRSFADESTSGNTNRPVPLKYLYANQSPLHEKLAKSEYLGGSKRLGRDCEKFYIGEVKGGGGLQQLEYTVDKQTAFPLEVRAFQNRQDRAENRPIWSWTAESFDRIDGHPFTLKSSVVVFDTSPKVDKSARQDRLFTTNFEVKKVAFDATSEAGQFWPDYQPGAVVWDQIRNKKWKVARDGSEADTQASAAASAPIQAVPPRTWSETLSLAGIVFGIVVIGGCVVAKLKNRRRTMTA